MCSNSLKHGLSADLFELLSGLTNILHSLNNLMLCVCFKFCMLNHSSRFLSLTADHHRLFRVNYFNIKYWLCQQIKARLTSQTISHTVKWKYHIVGNNQSNKAEVNFCLFSVTRGDGGCSRKHHCVCCDALLNMFPVPAAEAGNIWPACCQCNKGKAFIELPQILKAKGLKVIL